MLTDDEIRALLARYNAMQGQYPNLATSQDGTIAELCKEVLAWRESFPGYANREQTNATD